MYSGWRKVHFPKNMFLKIQVSHLVHEANWRVNTVIKTIDPPKPRNILIPSGDIAAAVRCHIQRGVQATIDSGQTNFMTEIRKITVLFVQLHDLVMEHAPSTTEPEPTQNVNYIYSCILTVQDGEDLDKIFLEVNGKLSKALDSLLVKQQQSDFSQIHQALSVMQSILFHYQGTVRQFLVGKLPSIAS
jgi:hypothetical protein